MRFSVEEIAQICHETNKAYCMMLRDYSQSSWEYAPEWIRKSVVNGVTFHIENPHSTPEESHKNWLAFKENEGWSYGPVKDPDKKEHPCFMPFEDLPVEQRVKDRLFKGIINAMLVE